MLFPSQSINYHPRLVYTSSDRSRAAQLNQRVTLIDVHFPRQSLPFVSPLTQINRLTIRNDAQLDILLCHSDDTADEIDARPVTRANDICDGGQ